MIVTCLLTVCAKNPSDSELEERITKIIEEEDEEIIRQHCYDYRSPPAPASASSVIRPSATRRVPDKTNSRHVSDKSDSSSACNCDASDIDDDELHQLLGVD